FGRCIQLAALRRADSRGGSAHDFAGGVAAGAMIGSMLAIAPATPMNATNVSDALAFLQAGLPFQDKA
ncbi:TetR family transcriptional regulator, partial [Nocardia fluminea]